MEPKTLKILTLFTAVLSVLFVSIAIALPWWNTVRVNEISHTSLFVETNTSYRIEYGIWGLCVSGMKDIEAPHSRYCFSYTTTSENTIPCALVQSECINSTELVSVGNACSDSFRAFINSANVPALNQTDPEQFLANSCGSLGSTTIIVAIIIPTLVGLCFLSLVVSLFCRSRRLKLLRTSAWITVLALCFGSILVMLWVSQSKPLRRSDGAAFGTSYYLHLLNALVLLCVLYLIAQYCRLPARQAPELIINETDLKSPCETFYRKHNLV